MKHWLINMFGRCPEVTIHPKALPVGTFGRSYSQMLIASGGNELYIFSLKSGDLPAGLTLSGGGWISGNPTAFLRGPAIGGAPDTLNAAAGAPKKRSQIGGGLITKTNSRHLGGMPLSVSSTPP
jgi:hypothetical protein